MLSLISSSCLAYEKFISFSYLLWSACRSACATTVLKLKPFSLSLSLAPSLLPAEAPGAYFGAIALRDWCLGMLELALFSSMFLLRYLVAYLSGADSVLSFLEDSPLFLDWGSAAELLFLCAEEAA